MFHITEFVGNMTFWYNNLIILRIKIIIEEMILVLELEMLVKLNKFLKNTEKKLNLSKKLSKQTKEKSRKFFQISKKAVNL